jgi:hypothetical protein
MNIDGRMDLQQARRAVNNILDSDHPLPCEPSRNWRFLDCNLTYLRRYFNLNIFLFSDVSKAKICRVSRNDEHTWKVAEVCRSECLLLFDSSLSPICSSTQQDILYSGTKLVYKALKCSLYNFR